MITVENLSSVLIDLGYEKLDNKYTRYFDALDATITVDFANKHIDYPDTLRCGRDTTLDFLHNENFVVLTCVTMLFDIGYRPENLYLEAPMPGGHDTPAGFSDIIVFDNFATEYMIIECKTTEQKNNDEYEKEWTKTLKNGGQLFNYFNTYRQSQYLILFTCDYTTSLTPLYKVISLIDNFEYIKSLKKKPPTFQSIRESNGGRDDYFNVWKETYKSDFSTNGIFEKNMEPFQVGTKKLSSNDLLEIDACSMQKKYNDYATILRKYNISSKENAFDKLINLFLAKIIDETKNAGELKCCWKGIAFDNYYDLHDRLQELYKEGMETFFNDKITFVENAKIEKAFSFLTSKADVAKATIFNYIKQLKYFNNNPFAILDVHNEELFNQNSAILKEVVSMLQQIKLKCSKQNQFLGDLFEGYLGQGVKQSEGQFFTPLPIVRFIVSSLPIEQIILSNKSEIPKVVDYACGAGHFLTEYASQMKNYVELNEQFEITDYYKAIIGIEKEYRLSKTAQVSAYMYGQDGIKIIYHDALSQDIPLVDDGTFSVLIANPPYSVKGFLETLDVDDKEKYTLNSYVSDPSSNKNIETFFVERANQLLKDNGVAAIILPTTILDSTSSLYTACREIIFKNFDIVAITCFSKYTFNKTSITTLTLFLRKKESVPNRAEHLLNRVNAWFAGNFNDDDAYNDNVLLQDYCDTVGVNYDDYCTFLSGNPNTAFLASEYINEYRSLFYDFSSRTNMRFINDTAKNIYKSLKTRMRSRAFNNLPDELQVDEIMKTFLNFLIAAEKDKLYYYMLVRNNNSDVLLITSPNEKVEAKKFLGYEWDNRKGSEGIKCLHLSTSSNNDEDEDADDDTIEQLLGMEGIITPLYDPSNLTAGNKLNTLIRNNYLHNDVNISSELAKFASLRPLENMINFDSPQFDKTIKSTFYKCIEFDTHFECVKLSDFLSTIETGSRPAGGVAMNENGVYSIGGEHIDNENGHVNLSSPKYVPISFYNASTQGKIRTGDILICKDGARTGKVAIVRDEFENHEAMVNEHVFIIRCQNPIEQKYLYYVLNSSVGQSLLKSKITGSAQGGLNKHNLLSIKIPQPNAETINLLLADCNRLDNTFNTTRMSIEEYRQKLQEFFNRYGIFIID